MARPETPTLLASGLLLLASSGAFGEPPAAASRKAVSASGYLKDLWQHSASALEERPYFLNIARARLSLEAQKPLGGEASPKLSAKADYDHEVLAGSFFRTREFRLFGLGEPRSWLDMEQTISTTATSLWRHRLHRGWLGLETETGLLRLGRQRIAWGANKFWNPTDVLNPYQPTSIEKDERRGTDALYLRQALGELSQGELAYAPQDHWHDTALLARGQTNWRGFDVSLMGGKVAPSTGSWMAGGDFAGNLLEGSLHGEWSYTDPRTRTPFWRAGLGYEYTFASDTKAWGLKDAAVVLEYFHNGGGSLDPRRYDLAALLTGREVTLARNYLGASLSKDLHPLLRLEFALIANLDDESLYAAPSLQWNALQNLYLTAGWQRFGGARSSELGRPPNLAFLQAQYYF